MINSSEQNYVSQLIEKANALPESEIKGFLISFLTMRSMVVGCLREIPEDKLDYAPSQNRGTHTLRDCIAELPIIEQELIKGIESGRRKMFSNDMFEEMFGTKRPIKKEILNSLMKNDGQLFKIVTSSSFESGKEVVFLGKDGQVKLNSTTMKILLSFRNHEVMYLGMIRRDLDAIG